MDLELKGKRALVTGATRGIGKAIARQLAIEGAEVVITGRSAESAAAAAAQLAEETRATVVGEPLETGDDASVSALRERLLARVGVIDILVNNAARVAGSAPPPTLEESTTELFWDDVNVKVVGYLRLARAFAPGMKSRRWGRIINVGGLAARRTTSAIGSLRNAAVTALTKNLADELGPFGVNVIALHPGTTRTEATPALLERRAAKSGKTIQEAETELAAASSIGRLIDAAEIGYVAAFLASPRSVAITGDAIAAGGGQKGVIYY
jgi:NAD(P)-dependent dehydrogenase (short-subunit alcohol dehydrogenase family)